MKLSGFIRKINAGLFEVFAEGVNYTCAARGKLRLHEDAPRVGDYCTIDISPDQQHTITRLLPRTNQLLRPAIANVDQVVVVTSLIEPQVDHSLLIRFIMLAQVAHIPVVVIYNKADLPDFPIEQLQHFKILLDKYHIPSFSSSSKSGEGLDDIRQVIHNKRSVFTGQSGVGKTSLLNALQPDLDRQTGAISKALGRGKHITRFSEFHWIGGGWVCDTPGFSSIEFRVDPTILAQKYVGFEALSLTCKFRGCLHVSEPHCAVKQAIEDGILDVEDYQTYLTLLEEVKNAKEMY